MLSPFSCIWLCATLWTTDCQAPLSVEFSRQEHWSGLPFPSPVHENEKWKKSLSSVWLFATPWTAAYQAPPSTGFSRQEYWSGLPLPSPISPKFLPAWECCLFAWKIICLWMKLLDHIFLPLENDSHGSTIFCHLCCFEKVLDKPGFPLLCDLLSQVGCPCNLSLNTRNCINIYFGVHYFILSFFRYKGPLLYPGQIFLQESFLIY